MAQLNEYRETLRGAGLRATAPRVAVLGYVTRSVSALSHAEVADALTREGFDRATVYRNLIDLTDAGLLHRVDLGDHVWRFTLSNRRHAPQRPEHPHFICNNCGAVECLPEDAVSVRAHRRTPPSLRQRGLQIQIRGLCDDCR